MKNKTQYIIIVVFCIIPIAFLIFFSEKDRQSKKEELNDYGKYSIGFLTGWNIPRHSPIHIHYNFFSSGSMSNKYNSEDALSSNLRLKDIETQGGKYIVKYSTKNPENNKLLLELGQVPDSIVNLLYFGGHDTIPKW